MIPAGRQPIDAERAARLHGMALKTALNKKLFDQPGFPAALTQGKRKRLWDEHQVRAHADGQPIPAIPPPQDDPNDLLERAEAAELWGVTPETWDDYVVSGYTPPPDAVIGGRELWHRRTLQEYSRPGRGAGAGRPVGARDREPRTTRPKSERLAEVARVLDEVGPEASTARIVARIVEVTEVSKASAYRLLREARQQHQGGRE